MKLATWGQLSGPQVKNIQRDSKGNLDAYRRTKLIARVHGDYIDLNFPQHPPFASLFELEWGFLFHQGALNGLASVFPHHRGGIKKGRHNAALLSKPKLLRIHEMATPVLLPALLIVFGAEGFFFAVADGLNAVRRNSCRDQRILH